MIIWEVKENGDGQRRPSPFFCTSQDLTFFDFSCIRDKPGCEQLPDWSGSRGISEEKTEQAYLQRDKKKDKLIDMGRILRNHSKPAGADERCREVSRK